MIQDPADGAMGGIGWTQVAAGEQNLPSTISITNIKGSEGNQIGFQRRPKVQSLEKSPAGVRDGVGATPTAEGGRRLGIVNCHPASR